MHKHFTSYTKHLYHEYFLSYSLVIDFGLYKSFSLPNGILIFLTLNYLFEDKYFYNLLQVRFDIVKQATKQLLKMF